MTRMRKTTFGRVLAAALAAGFSGWLAAAPAAANEAQKLIDDSASMLRAFMNDRAVWDDVRPHFREARAVVLAPDVIEAGFLFGAAGGQCVMAARTADGGWSAPSFCVVGEASVGMQIGFQKSELLMMAMNEGALNQLIAGTARLGGNAGLAAGLVGRSVGGETTLNLALDIVAVSRNQGLYGGVTLDGGWIEPDDEFNQVYYGRAVNARHILADGRVSNLATDVLRHALEQADEADRAEY